MSDDNSTDKWFTKDNAYEEITVGVIKLLMELPIFKMHKIESMVYKWQIS